MKKDKLLPCPFCGGSEDYVGLYLENSGFIVLCKNCSCNVFDISKTNVIKKWNARYIPLSKNLKTDPLKLKKNDILIGEKE